MWFLELVQIVVKRRKLIILNTFAVTLLAAIIAFLLPKTYRSHSTILPPENESPLAGLAGLTAGHIAQAVTNFTLPLMATPSDLYASMLESETILRETVDSLALQKIYKSETVWNAVGVLKDHVHISVEPEGIVMVEADAGSAELSASIANSLVYFLDQFNRTLQNQKGKENVSFIERRLVETDGALNSAEKELKEFQEKNRAISLELQSQALIDNLAQQKALLTTSEIELEVLKRTLYPNHPELLKKEMAVAEIRRKLKDIEEGAANQSDSTLSALDIPLSRIPDLSLQFAVLKRNAKIQELTYELLSQQLEMARIQSHRDVPTIMVLDHARPPESAIKPRKKVIVGMAFILALALSVGYVVVREKLLKPQGNAASTLTTLAGFAREISRKPLG